MKIALMVLLLISSLGDAHASTDDCNSLMKSRWETSLNDLASLRIDLDLQRASGAQSSIGQALESSYARKFGELLDFQKRQSIEGDLEVLLKRKISENQRTKKFQAEELAHIATAQAAVVKPMFVMLDVKVQDYTSLPWKMAKGTAIQTDPNTVIVASVDQIASRLNYARLDLTTQKFENSAIDLQYKPESVQLVGDSNIYVESTRALLDVNSKTKNQSVVVKFNYPLVGRSRALLSGGQLVFAGGSSNQLGNRYEVLLFDPSKLIQTELPTPLTPRIYPHLIALKDGRILVVGGVTTGGHLAKSVEIIDPAKNTVKKLGSLSKGRRDFTATILSDGRVVLIGGTDLIEVIDVAAKKIDLVGKLPQYRQGHAATLLPDDRILVSGGVTVGGYLDSVIAVDPDGGPIQHLAYLNSDRMGHSQVMISDHEILILGGSASIAGALSNTEKISWKVGK